MYPSRKIQAILEIVAVIISLTVMAFIIGTWMPLIAKDLAINFDFWAAATFFATGLFMVIPFGFMMFILQTALREFFSGVWSLFLDSVSLIVWGLTNWLFSSFMSRLVTSVPGIDARVVVTLQAIFALVTLLPIVLFIFHDIAEIRNKPSKISELIMLN